MTGTRARRLTLYVAFPKPQVPLYEAPEAMTEKRKIAESRMNSREFIAPVLWLQKDRDAPSYRVHPEGNSKAIWKGPFASWVASSGIGVIKIIVLFVNCFINKFAVYCYVL